MFEEPALATDRLVTVPASPASLLRRVRLRGDLRL
jgi:hypothetical protein